MNDYFEDVISDWYRLQVLWAFDLLTSFLR